MTTSTGTPTSTPSPSPSARATWTPVLALTAGITMLVSSEFLPAGVLPGLAADLGVTEGTAGLAVAATAVAGFLTAPTIAVVLPRADRRTVLVALLVIGAVANLIVAVAPAFAVLLVGRLLLGVAVAGYWAFAFAAGIRAVPGRAATVSTTLALGVSIATIAGVPLGSLLGDLFGWRLVFGVAAALTAASAAAVWFAMPSVPAQPGAGLTMLRQALTNRRLLLGIASLLVVVLGNFAAYPFIRLAIERVDASVVPLLLLLWGVGGLAGNLVAGSLSRRLRLATTLGPALFGLALATLAGAGAGSLWVVVPAVILWGFGMNMVPVATQLWVTTAEPRRTESALALQVTAFQAAITLGAVLGGRLLDGAGLTPVLLTGAVLAIAGSAGFACLRGRPA
ncbi:MFS transporter [Isoptericola sp. S6320L]|uniref:MFS transporter n=1 Tax=Isoptericola sp. S6320L TaxID=2926411 RepID=UPI001FF4A743|nr:MFS transporter [Isoptericola sp. S6320L]MCK0117205.1 MFS transporter [Isoptericola sp. S6320L]